MHIKGRVLVDRKLVLDEILNFNESVSELPTLVLIFFLSHIISLFFPLLSVMDVWVIDLGF